MLEALFNKKGEQIILKEFNNQFIREGRFPKKYLENLKFIAKVREEIIEDKADIKKQNSEKNEINFAKKRREVDKARRKASIVTNALIEFNERCDFLSMDRSRFILKNNKQKINIFFLRNTFIVDGSSISKISDNKIIKSNPEELNKQILEQKGKDHKIDLETVQFLKKQYKDFELIY